MTKEKDIIQSLSNPLFRLISEAADELSLETYVVGGFVRDLLLNKPSKDIDIVTIGSGITLARHVAEKAGKKNRLKVYGRFGTAMIHHNNYAIEFVGARKESYQKDSRKPIVEDGTLKDDQNRRDFSINAMAIRLNKSFFGQITDPFDGRQDLINGIIRTPLDPDITFSDDPLRILRAIRFAATLHFKIEETTFIGIKKQVRRLEIVSAERIADELNKIIAAEKPSYGITLMDESDVLQQLLPELCRLKGVEKINNIGHKDNFLHTLEVLDNVARQSDNIWLRWAALLHDIGKPKTKRFDKKTGWTFHGHEVVGTRIAANIFKRLKLPMNEPLTYVNKLINLHLRPIALVENIVTDAAVRRLLFDAGDIIDDLMLLCKADITSKNIKKKAAYIKNFEHVKQKIVDIEERDRIRNWQPPVSGDVIMETFDIPPSKIVGTIKTAIREAILDGEIPNQYADAYQFMITQGLQHGLKAVNAKWKNNPPISKKEANQ